MEMPTSFANVLKGMSTDDLKELLEWNSASTCNDLAVAMIQAELENREE